MNSRLFIDGSRQTSGSEKTFKERGNPEIQMELKLPTRPSCIDPFAA
jgi:hypothetical protein